MTGGQSLWQVRLADAAEKDFREIIRWTLQQFGETQAAAYARTLSAALVSLSEGPGVSGTRPREEIGKGIFTLHVARNGARGRHFIVFREGRGKDGKIIEVLRILHDSMDLARHLPHHRNP
ncbi:MAG: type II toxin-antitoxin system RelE/ParE family toxin [Pseudomonadota bacterium]